MYRAPKLNAGPNHSEKTFQQYLQRIKAAASKREARTIYYQAEINVHITKEDLEKLLFERLKIE